jgi:hypothetical protein
LPEPHAPHVAPSLQPKKTEEEERLETSTDNFFVK